MDFFSIVSFLDSATGMLVAVIDQYGFLAMAVVTFFMGETVILVAILLALRGSLSLEEVFAGAILGTITADLFWFVVGRYFPQRVIPKSVSKHILGPAHSFFSVITRDKVFLPLFFLKFLIGIRLAIIFYYSRQSISLVRFFIYDFFGTIFYIVVLTGIGVVFSKFIVNVFPVFHTLTSVFSGVVIVLLISYLASKYLASRQKLS